MAHRYAIWSGYQISQADFKELIDSIPAASEYLEYYRNPEKPSADISDYLCFWNHWRNRLREDLQRRVPRMLLRYYAETDEVIGPCDRRISHILFPLRYVAFKHESQFSPDHPGYKTLMEPTERERKFIATLAKIVAQSDGVMDLSKLEWTAMKESHPSRGPVTV